MPSLESVGLDKFQIEPFKRPIRKKWDVIAIWMHALKAFLIGEDFVPEWDRAGSLTIAVSAMSRLFFESTSGEKLYSVSFPFKLKEEDEQRVFRTRGNHLLNSKTTSEILAIVADRSTLEQTDFYGFIETIEEFSADEVSTWGLLRELMLAEDGYIRYDWDVTRKDGAKHPEFHFDVSYSSEATYKIGVSSPINQSTFIDMLDLETDCHFLTSATK